MQVRIFICSLSQFQDFTNYGPDGDIGRTVVFGLELVRRIYPVVVLGSAGTQVRTRFSPVSSFVYQRP